MSDGYSERTGPGLFGEPINTLSNVGFFVAAWAAARLLHRAENPREARPLLALMILVGMGSTTFHMFATGWARVLDVVPILAFQVASLWLYLRRVVGAPASVATPVVGLLVTAALVARRFSSFLNGSLTYVPALAFLLGLALHRESRVRKEPHLLVSATGVFSGALLFRTVDRAASPLLSFGTHFLWHLLNAGTMYLVFRAFVVSSTAGTDEHRAPVEGNKVGPKAEPRGTPGA